MKLGVYVLAVGAMATGVVDLIWRSFDPAEQPIQAFGDNVPRQTAIFACVIAVVLIVGAIAMVRPRSARLGSAMVGAASLLFAVFWLPRLYWTAVIIGWWGPIGVLGGIGQQVIIAAAATIVYVSASPTGPTSRGAARIARWVFGVSTIFFGLTHLTSIPQVARMVPKYMPLGGDFWAALTGVAFIVAGIALVSGLLDVLAARLLTLMFVVFSALALPPLIVAYPHSQGVWGANVYNIAAIGAAWVLADCLASRARAPARI